MYFSDPERFCWIAPDTCQHGMTVAFWFQYKGSDHNAPGIITSANYPPSETNHPNPNAFGIYYFTDTPKVFVYMAGNVSTVNRNYYQTNVGVNLHPNSWYHIALSFSLGNGLRLCLNGGQVCYIWFKTFDRPDRWLPKLVVIQNFKLFLIHS